MFTKRNLEHLISWAGYIKHKGDWTGWDKVLLKKLESEHRKASKHLAKYKEVEPKQPRSYTH